MSTIDSPKIIRKLIEKQGADPGGHCYGRRATCQIWQYTSGFDTVCYKLIYGMYPTGDDDKTAAMTFLAFGNIKEGHPPTCIFKDGQLTDDGIRWWFHTWEDLPPGLPILE